MKRRLHRTMFPALCALSLLVAGCGHQVRNSWPDDVNKTFRATVKTAWLPGAPGSPDDLGRLKAYYEALRTRVGVQNLEIQYIGCLQCASLETTSPPSELTFIFFQQHSKDLYAFTAAWKDVQASALGTPNFTLTFDKEAPPAQACTQPKPICYPNPICVSTSACDANLVEPGCQKCPP